MPSKCILILLDGLGDRSHEVLDHRTPLQAAHTPNLDRLAGLGANGLYHAASFGQALPSENAHFTMFGYDPQDFPGRGALEALGAGIALGSEEVAVLAHLASLHEEQGCLILDQDVPQASAAEAAALAEAVAEFRTAGVAVRFMPTKGIFGILTLKGEVSPYVTDTNTMLEGRPLADVKPWQEHEGHPAARNTAAVLAAYLRWSYRRLQEHPVNEARRGKGLSPINGLITQRAGRLKQVRSFHERNGLRGLTISSGHIYWGLGSYLGLDVHKVADRGDPAGEIAERLTIALDSLGKYDFIHVHTKAADEAAHKKDPLLKKTVIEALDEGIGRVGEALLKIPELLLVVTADHSTPSSGALIHSGEPVPLLMVGQGVRRDRVCRFDEIWAAEGALGCVRGGEFMDLILNHLDKTRLAGTREAPAALRYWPVGYEPFRVG